MNKSQLAENIAKKSGIPKKEVEMIVNSVFEEISSALEQGERVQVVGFGTFETRRRASRIGRNPQSGETITIPEANVPAFRAGNKLKSMVR